MQRLGCTDADFGIGLLEQHRKLDTCGGVKAPGERIVDEPIWAAALNSTCGGKP